MKTLLNLLWLIFGGIWMGIGWWIAGLIMVLTVVGIPWAKACFVIGQFAFWPFGRRAVDRDVATGRQDIGTGWLGDPFWARFAVILVNVWVGAPFFMIMYLAALKSVPDQLYEAAAIDGANWWQKLWYVTLPMMRNIISITVLFSLIVTFSNFDIVRILTGGGPIDQTHVFATWAFSLSIESNDIPLGASVSLFMVPVLAVAAIYILRSINRRGNEA